MPARYQRQYTISPGQSGRELIDEIAHMVDAAGVAVSVQLKDAHEDLRLIVVVPDEIRGWAASRLTRFDDALRAEGPLPMQ
jgi:hypothetical protein